MIDIDRAIIESKTKENVSNGGSACYDFGDAVLVKYISDLQYGYRRARENAEEIMEKVNKKNELGVNTPKHLGIKRITEGNIDYCYLLEQKCPGINCNDMGKYGVSFDELCDNLKYFYDIPLEHYKKLVSDGCQLFDMGVEPKSKNLFYDEKSGFWYIDFLGNDRNGPFDKNDIRKEFLAIKNIIPKILNMTSSMKYGTELSSEQYDKINTFKAGIQSKMIFAIREVLPNVEKYEKFLLFKEPVEIKRKLMENGVVSSNLFELEENDYPIYDELCNAVINNLIERVNMGEKYWEIEVNSIRNESDLFYLRDMWCIHKDNELKPEEFEDKYDFEYKAKSNFDNYIMTRLIARLKELEPTENNKSFLEEAKKAKKTMN